MNTTLWHRLSGRNTLLIIVALAALIAVALSLMSRSDERIIRRALRDAAQALEKNGPENPIVAARRAERVTDILSDTPAIEVFETDWQITSLSEARSAVFHARASAEQISVRLHDISVTVDDARQQAQLTGTAIVRGIATHDRSEGREIVEFMTEWKKTPDGWRLAVLRSVDAIRRIQ